MTCFSGSFTSGSHHHQHNLGRKWRWYHLLVYDSVFGILLKIHNSSEKNHLTVKHWNKISCGQKFYGSSTSCPSFPLWKKKGDVIISSLRDSGPFLKIHYLICKWCERWAERRFFSLNRDRTVRILWNGEISSKRTHLDPLA